MIKEKAENEAKSMKVSASAEIQKEKESMLHEIKSQSIDLILKFNKKLFEKETVNKDFIEKELSSIR
jgi:F0F1-type ATP synthase membrane subunit b/b'